MKVLWFSWKDIKHPGAGGAELVMHEISKRLVAAGHEVTILTAAYDDAAQFDTIDGINIIRVGRNRYLQPAVALFYYLRHLRNKYDLLIEAVNTAPYFGVFCKGRARSVLFYHQLARQIWFHEAPFPINWIGYLFLEPVATFLLGKSRSTVITVSESTKRDLLRFGFKAERIHIVSEGLHIEPVEDLGKIKKYAKPTMLSHGAMRGMKQTLDQIKAFEIAKQTIPDLQLKVSGSSSGAYGQKVVAYIQASPYTKDIDYLGRTTDAQKMELMQKCHLITVTSVKEGWGLIVTETNSQGTPAVVYNADGLRDSVRNTETGIVTDPNPEALAQGIVRILQDPVAYQTMRHNAWEWSKQITFEQCYKDVIEAIL